MQRLLEYIFFVHVAHPYSKIEKFGPNPFFQEVNTVVICWRAKVAVASLAFDNIGGNKKRASFCLC